MNGKFILILFICLNLSTLVASSVCLEVENNCSFGKNIVLELFLPSETIANAQNVEGALNENAGTGLNSNFEDSIGDITKEQSGGTFIDNTGFSFLDSLKMVLGVISLILPIPLVTFIISVGFPLWLTILLGLLPIFLYILAIIEFIRGSNF